MAIQGNINQLINATAYFAKPIGEKRRLEKEAIGEREKLRKQHGIAKKFVNEGLPQQFVQEHAKEWEDFARSEWGREPTEESFHNYIKTMKDRQALDREYVKVEEERAEARHMREMRKSVMLEEERKKFRAQLQEEEKKKQEEALLGGKI